jgi:hypothetical protein
MKIWGRRPGAMGPCSPGPPLNFYPSPAKLPPQEDPAPAVQP